MPIDPARVQALFLAAADLADPIERAAYLDRECAGDAGLRTRVDALLRAIDQPDSLLDAPIAPAAGGETQTLPAAAADDTADALAFLSPPGRPDSLGRLGHYEVLEVLGRGGFGVVYRAFDDVLQRVVAVKVLAPSLAVTSPARKRFLREAQSAAKIQHENVVRIIEIGEHPLPYLVMEFIAGETLQQRLDRTGPLEVPEVLRIGRQIAAGLAAAHETGLIHRDIKPSNILIGKGPDEPVKITDFGLARAADDASLTRSGTVAGTPLYMAPEQARGETLDHRADLFSMGSVLYTMLTGRPPFRASGTLAVLKRVAEDDPRPMHEVIPEVPDWLCRIVDRLHAKDPAARYQIAREVANVLADCEQQLKSHGALRDRSRIPAGRPPRRRFGRRWAWAAGLAAAALLLLGAWFGRPAWLYATDRGELELVPQDGLVAIIVLKNDEGVIDDNKLHPLVTDWLGMKTGHTLKLPPGTYQLNAGTAPPGPRIVHWEVTTSDPLGSNRLLVPGEGLMGWTVIVNVRRGERVSVRAVLGTPLPAPSPPQTEVRQEVSGWGTAIDPRGDCRFEPHGDSLVISVPGGTHNLNPTQRFQDVTAPRILRAAPGDFNFDVKVDAFPVPAPGTSSTGMHSYTGAGSVVWKDAGTFVRFFRAANGETRRVIVSVESYRDGQHQGYQDFDIADAGTWLRVGRRGDDLRFWSSTDGEHWAEVSLGVPIRLGGPVEAGVAAVNSTTKPFAPRFSRFELHQGTGDAERRWVPLFNGKDLTGWKPVGDLRAQVTDGILRSDYLGWLRTEKAYENYSLVLEYRYPKAQNWDDEVALFLHMEADPKPFAKCVIVKLDHTGTGKIYPEFGAKGGTTKLTGKTMPRGQWNQIAVTSRGGSVEVALNGETLGTVTGCDPTRGFIGFNSRASELQVRRVEIKELPADGAPQPADSRPDHEKLQGTWVAMNGENHGEALKPDELKRLRLEFTGSRVHVTMVNGLEEAGTFKVDPSRDPRAIDMNFDGKTKRAMFGIYRLEGNRLTLCLEDFDQPRPDRFESGPEPKQNRLVVVLRRVDPQDEGWVPLFNGKDLPGTAEGPADRWQVKGQLLTGTGETGLLLRKDLGDFHCRIEAKVVSPGMAHVDFRVARSPTWISGQAVLESRFVKNRAGGLALYKAPKEGEVLVASPNPPSSSDGWFTIEIIARGKKATIKVDGAITAERTISELPDRGDLILSIVDKGTVIQFRKIEIKELPAK